MVRNPRSLARRLGPSGLVLIAACLLGTCKADNVVGPPSGGTLQVSPERVVDSAALGSRAARVMTVAISKSAAGELAWTATPLHASPWLSLSAASGTAPSTLHAAADPTGLAAGVYEDTIVVMARSPAGGEARIAIQFAIHPCALGPISLDVEVTGRLDAADCAGPHRGAMFADLYSFNGSAGDSVSVELESGQFSPYLILDTATAPSVPPLAESGICAYAVAEPCLRYQRLPRSGMFVIEATTLVAGDSGAYRLRLFRPRPPSPVESLAQLGGDSTTAISTGGVTADSAIVLRGVASDPDRGDSLRLAVEVRPVNVVFTGVPTATGSLVPAGGGAVVRVNGLSDNTAYHWQARVVDQTGRASTWTDYGDNAESVPDLSVAINDGPTAPTDLGQFESDGLAAIPVGGVTDEASPVLKGTVLDPDPGDSARLDVEVRALGTPFTGVPTESSALVASGSIAAVTVDGLANQTEFHWQARAVDRSGRAGPWSAFGDNDDARADFHISVAEAPSSPSGAGQFRADGVTAIAVGDTIPERAVHFHATLTDANPGDQLRLEVELQPFSAPFTDAATGSSVPVASGDVGTVAITGLAENASYHWQARVVDQSGRASAWLAFGNNSEAASDFHVRVPATQLVFTVHPGTTASGAAIAPGVRVAARDADGNTLASFSAPITVVLGSNSAGGTLSGTLTVNAVAGIATFADLRIDRAGSGYTLVASATGPAAATSDAFGITPGPAVRLAIMTQPSATAPSGVPFSQQPAVQLLDAADNAVSQAGATVEAAIISGDGTLGGTTAVLTNASGVAVFTDLLLIGTVGPRTLGFSGPGLDGVTSSTVNVTAGAASTVALHAGDELSATAGGAVAVPPSVIVRDASGNPVSGVAVTFVAAPGNGTVSPVTPVLTNTSGVAAVTSWTLGTMAGTDSLTATTSPALTGSPVVFTATAVAGAPAILVKSSGDNLTGEVGSTLGTPHEVTVRDEHGNPVAGVPISWAAGAGGGVSPLLGTTDLNGHASAVRTLGGTAGMQSTTATAALSGGSTTVTFNVQATVGEATQMSIEGGNNQVDTVGQTLPTALAVRVADQFNNPVPNVQITWAVLDGGGAVNPLSSLTDGNGIATTSWTLGTTMALADSVEEVRATGVALSLTFTAFTVPGPVSPTQTSVTTFPATIPASSGTSASTLTITVRDAFGNVIKGQPVVLTATGTGNTLTQPATPTDANGVATGTLSATVAEGKTVSVTIAGTAVTQTAVVNVTPAGVSAEQSSVVAVPNTITASNGTSSTTITVTARDQFGNPIEGAGVVLAATGTGIAVTQPTTTNASGVATGTLSSTEAGDKVVSAMIAGTVVTETVPVTVTPASVSAAQSRVTAAPTAITASSGASSATITVTARDDFGNPIEGATVTLATTGTGNTVTQPATTTDASGVATGTLSATAAGDKVVSAMIAGTGVTQTAIVTVTPAGVSAGQSTVTTEPGTITASNGASSATITVTARDDFGNPIEGATVTLALTVTGSGNTLTQPGATTNASGVATGMLSSIAAGDKVVSAMIAGTGVTQTATVTVHAAGVDPAQSTVVVAPTTLAASTGASSATITVTARDQFGNPIEGATLALTVTGSGNTLTQPGATTNASGVATGMLSSIAAGDKVVSATIGGTGVTQTATVTVVAAGVSAGLSTVTVAPVTITASNGASSATITVTARDDFGNPIEGATVTLAATGTGNAITQPTTTDAGGVATGSLSATGAGDKVVSATIGGTAVTQTATVTVMPAGVSAGLSAVAVAPVTITASSGASNATITVTARDDFGNPIEGVTVTLAATGTGNTITQPTTTDASGVATGSLSATMAEGKTVSVTIDGTGITQTAGVTVTPAGVDAAHSTVAAASGSITAGSGVATITVTARDPFDNPIEGATVVLAATGSGNTLTQPASTTDANGAATGSLSATVAEGKTVSVTIDGTGITQTAGVTVTAAGVDAAQSTVAATLDTITASNGASSTTIAVTARDQFGNPIEGATVVLAATGGGSTLAQPLGPTGANGVATGTLSATGAGDKVVSATIAGTAVTQTAVVSVLPAEVSAGQSTVAAAPGSISAGNGVATITVTARDPFGNPIAGATVVLAATGDGNTLTQPGTTTNASGIATGVLSATVAEPKIVSATINATVITQTAAVTVIPDAVSAAQSTVSAAPASITAGSGVATITVTARDASGNPIEGVTVVLAATGSGNTLTQPLGPTSASGIATGMLNATAAGDKVVSATIAGVAVSQTTTVTVVAAGVDAALSTVAATPGLITAGSGVATIRVTARDPFGNPIEGATVVLAATGSGNTLTQPGMTTDANGVATGTLSATGAGDKVVSAAIAGTGVTQTATLMVIPAEVSAGQSTVVAAPQAITASNGATSATITVTARDQFGNLIDGATVVLAASGAGNTLTQPLGPTSGGGEATGALSATGAGDKVVSATINGIGITQTATVTVEPAGIDAARSTVAAAPASITAGSGVATITVTARDPFGNPIEGATVVLAATGSGITLTQPGTPTDATGVATGLLSATGAGDKVVSAAISGTSITQTATVAVEATGVDGAQSTVVAAPGSITAGSGVATITVTARDAFGNPIQGATVSLAATGSGSTLAQPVTTTDASGQTTGTLGATGAGEKIIAATIAGTGATQTATVTVTAASVSAAQSTVIVAPGSITAGSGVATIAVTARDAFGNPIDDATVLLAATGSGNTLTQPVSTNENGVTTGTLSATVAEGKTVSVTIDGTALTQTATVTVTATGVSAAQSTVAAAPTTITASNGARSATVTVTARDQFGNPIEGATVVLAATGSGNTLTQPLGLTNTSGVATGTLSATAAGDNVVSATIAGTGVTQTTTVTVTPADVSAAQSTVAAAPETITASSGASSATVTVTARDQFGNPIAGAAVVLAATGSGNILAQPAATDANGVATGTLSATVAEEKTVSVTIVGTGVTQTATVTVIPAGVSATQSTVTADPGTVTASNGESSATITVTARDQFGNPIQGATVILAAGATGNTLTQPGTTTDADGVATGTLSATTGGSKVVSATISGTAVTQTATVTVIPAGVNAAQSTVVASPGTVTVGTGVAMITVTARDQFGNPIPGATVVLAVSGTGNTLTQPATTTSADGVATGTLSATAAEDKVVSATIAGTGVTQTATVTVTATGVSAARSMVVAAPATITASTGASSATITVTARDEFDNPIQGLTVVLAATGSGNALTQPAMTTDANGQATGTLSATVAGARVVSATIAGTAVTQTATVGVTAAGVSAGQSTMTAAPGAITASTGASSATITVTARDAFGNPIEGATVVLAATGTGNTLTQPGMSTNASGEATGTLSATTAEPKILSATVDGTGVTQTATVTVAPTGVSAAQSTVVAAPTAITASEGASNATITVTARDEFGNLLDGATVVLAATGTGNILSQPGATNASGVATGTLSATVAEEKTVSVTIDGIGVTQTAVVTVTAASVSAAQSLVAASPETITVGTGVATITVTARDAFGNPIEGATVELAATGTANTLTQPGATDANGVAMGTLSATVAEDKVVSATIAGTGVTQSATVTVVAAGVNAAQSTVAASPASITAGSGIATITVTARDGFGNPVEGVTVVLAATGSGNILTQPGTTNASGVATGTLSATAAESKIITATVDGMVVTQQANVLVTSAAADHLVFLVQPTSTTTAGSSMAPPVEVEIRDEFANRVTSATNEVTLAIATNPAGGTLIGGGPVAAVGGVASFASLSVDKAGTGYTLAASSPGLTGATSAAFTVIAGAVSPAQSTVAAAPESIGESELSTITVAAQDANGNPIEGATVVLAATGSAAVLTQPAGPTGADGVVTGTLSATLSGTKVVSALINGTPIVQTASLTVQPPPGSVVFVGAGDIGDCETTGDEATVLLLDAIPGTVFTAGDNAYPNGAASDFANCYDPTWGRHKARTRPSPGNHEYRTSGAEPYFAYFGANAGPAGLGYYSYDLGDWHIISLNSEISKAVGSPQEVWLRADLAANTKQCTLAYWHKPLFSSGEHGGLPGSKPLWKALQQYNAEVVVVGHDHGYERFAPQDTIGVADPTNGLRQFVVGTGGTELRGMSTPVANSEVRNSDTHGVLRFTLHSSGYEWEFMPVAGKTFTDSGSGTCH